MLSTRPIQISIDGEHRHFAKTPGRTLKSRSALQENLVHHVPKTGNVKGKNALQQTPFLPKTLQPQRLFKDPISKTAAHVSLRPLGDKTPFPNRVANQAILPPTASKVAKPSFVSVTPGELPLPSSTRKHLRIPRSASKNFETPAPKGHHWDVSDISIENADIADVVNKSIEEEDCDEIEYMPPKSIELPFDPGFEMPNYKEVGKNLLALTFPYLLDEPSMDDKELMFNQSEAEMESFFKTDLLVLPELEDDNLFHETALKLGPLITQNTTELRSVRARATAAPDNRAASRSAISSQVRQGVVRSTSVASSRAPSATAKTVSRTKSGVPTSSQSRLPTSSSRSANLTAKADKISTAVSTGTQPPQRSGVNPSQATTFSGLPRNGTNSSRLTSKVAPPRTMSTYSGKPSGPAAVGLPNKEGTVAKRAVVTSGHSVKSVSRPALSGTSARKATMPVSAKAEDADILASQDDWQVEEFLFDV